MARLEKLLGIFLILIGPILIYLISKSAFKKVNECEGLLDALPWLLIATLTIPLGMSISVVGFLYLKGEFNLTQKSS